MSLTLKLTSLGIRTVAKPIGNLIKSQARENEGFKAFCVKFAQGLHRWDARMRLGLLEDSEAITRQIDREAASIEAKRLRSQKRPPPSTPTAKTEEQAKADEDARQRERKFIEGKVRHDEQEKKARMFKPLSESKAIETGANFASEAFVFIIGVSLLLFENWRSKRKANNRREDVQERLESLEEIVKGSQQEKEGLEQHIKSLVAEMEHIKASNKSIDQAGGLGGASSGAQQSESSPNAEAEGTSKGEKNKAPQSAASNGLIAPKRE